MSNIERYQLQQELATRATKRELDRRFQEGLLAMYQEQGERVAVAVRLQGGAILSGELMSWEQALGAQAQLIAENDPAAGARAGYVLDQLAVNGSRVIGMYMGAVKR